MQKKNDKKKSMQFCKNKNKKQKHYGMHVVIFAFWDKICTSQII